MVAYIFQRLAQKGAKQGISQDNTADARAWFRSNAKKVSSVNHRRILKEEDRLQKRINRYSIGRMYMFLYDAKWKDTLPYWDMFPLVFPIELYDDGFLGINLHYLSPFLRAKLMDALYTTANNKKFNDTTKLRITYGILKSASKFKYFEPCVKRYLFSQCKSRFFYVAPNEWDMALLLPTERFQKASNAKVFRDSARRIN